MRKIKYKEPSESLTKISAPNFEGKNRSSVGMEGFVGEYYFMNIADLKPFKNQARKTFHEEDIKELAATIKEHGIRQPLTILKTDSGHFEVVSGERRLRAAKSIGIEKVPCIIIDSEEKAEEIALIENIQRSDLHPVEFGDAINSLLGKNQWGDLSKLATKLGKDHSTLSNHLAYAKLPSTIKMFLVQNDIRSRDILRKLLKANSLQEMEKIVGIGKTPKIAGVKSILRVNLDLDKFIIQGKAISKLTLEQKINLKSCLEQIIKQIDTK